MELFTARGYEQTTASQIAARAGVTERTYFRHFADKRDILFEGEERLAAVLTGTIVGAPPELTPMAVLLRAFHGLAETFEGDRAFSAPRQAIIAATPSLRERESSKHAALIDAVASALVRRGLQPKTAALAAQLGGAAFIHALSTWFEDPSGGLGRHLDWAFETMARLGQ